MIRLTWISPTSEDTLARYITLPLSPSQPVIADDNIICLEPF